MPLITGSGVLSGVTAPAGDIAGDGGLTGANVDVGAGIHGTGDEYGAVVVAGSGASCGVNSVPLVAGSGVLSGVIAQAAGDVRSAGSSKHNARKSVRIKQPKKNTTFVVIAMF